MAPSNSTPPPSSQPQSSIPAWATPLAIIAVFVIVIAILYVVLRFFPSGKSAASNTEPSPQWYRTVARTPLRYPIRSTRSPSSETLTYPPPAYFKDPTLPSYDHLEEALCSRSSGPQDPPERWDPPPRAAAAVN